MPRPKKPIEKAIAEGYRRDRVNFAFPVPPDGEIKPPARLGKEALKKWNEAFPLLVKMGVMTTADVDALALYCETFEIYLKAKDDINKNGFEVCSDSGAVKTSPSVAVLKDTSTLMLRILSEFGFTPSSRAKVKSTQDKSTDLEKFLNAVG